MFCSYQEMYYSVNNMSVIVDKRLETIIIPSSVTEFCIDNNDFYNGTLKEIIVLGKSSLDEFEDFEIYHDKNSINIIFKP